MTTDTAARIAALVAACLPGVDPETLSDDTLFADLPGDSLDAFEIVMAIEDELHIGLGADDVETVASFGDLVRLVDKALAAAAEPADDRPALPSADEPLD